MSAHKITYARPVTLVWTRRDFHVVDGFTVPYVETVSLRDYEQGEANWQVPGVYLGHDVDTAGRHALAVGV